MKRDWIDRYSDDPIFLQIVRRVKYLVARGEYKPGDQLDPIYALAEELKINFNTVVKAYRELANAGVAYNRGNVGTFIADSPAVHALVRRFTALEKALNKVIEVTEQEGGSVKDLVELLIEHERELKKRQTEG